MLAEEFLGNINEDGYLDCPIEEILAGINEMIRASPRSAGSTPTTRRCSRAAEART
jgi:RNA polymerase sigma-54 factor